MRGNRDNVAGRMTMALIGAIAGGSIWVLAELLDDVLTNPHLYLFVSAAVGGFFAVLLGLAGPAPVRRAAVSATLLAGLAAALLFWASLRYEEIAPFQAQTFGLLAWGVLLFVATPFVSAGLETGGRWPEYARLFDHSWNIAVRYGAAWIFVGIFWLVLFLSDALLDMVGVTIIDDLIKIDVMPFVLSGLTLGLGLSVVHEMRDYVSPFLILRLLRLLLPVLVVVVLVFIVALPFRGLSGLFQEFSAALTLMGVALGAITLVSTAIDRDDRQGVSGRIMQLATRALALLLPVLAALALFAVWVRVQDYGWTPQRVAACTAAAMATSYAIAYAGSVLMGRGWAGRIRAVNVAMAMAVIIVACLWLTPLFNAQRISANSQVDRYTSGQARADALPIWEMTHDWGRAGRNGIDRLAALEGDGHDEVKSAVERALAVGSFYEFDHSNKASTLGERAERLRDKLTILPADADLSADVLATMYEFSFEDWERKCLEAAAPGCVVVLGQLDTSNTGQEGFIFLPAGNRGFEPVSLRVTDGKIELGGYAAPMNAQGRSTITAEHIEALLAGEWTIAPSRRRALWIGEIEILPTN